MTEPWTRERQEAARHTPLEPKDQHAVLDLIDKLPTTKDGVYVVPGMKLWSVLRDGEVGLAPAVMHESDNWSDVKSCKSYIEEHCYSTREAAAEAAKEVGDGIK